MPRALVDKIKRARTFGQGFATTEYVAAALLDMAWHTLPVGPQQPDVDAFEAQALKRFAVDVPEVPPRYRTRYFAHIWNGGYYAGYCGCVRATRRRRVPRSDARRGAQGRVLLHRTRAARGRRGAVPGAVSSPAGRPQPRARQALRHRRRRDQRRLRGPGHVHRAAGARR